MRDPGRRHSHRGPSATPSTRGVPGCWPTAATSCATRWARVLSDASLRERLSPRRAGTRVVHLGGDRTRHPRGAGRRGDAPAPPPVTARNRELRLTESPVTGAVTTRLDAVPRAPARHRVRRARAARVRPAAAHRAREGRGRHEAVPLPRPGPAHGAGVVDVGPEHRVRHRHPPEHRVPVPDGPLLLVARPDRGPRLGRAAASGSARILLFAGLGMLYLFRTLGLRGAGRDRRRARVHAAARTRSTTRRGISVILLPWAGLPVDARVLIRGPAPGGWRYPALLRADGPGDRERQRDRARLRRHRAVLWIPYAVWVLHEVRLAPRATVTAQDRRPRRHVAVVDGRVCGRRAATASTSCGTPRRSAVGPASLPNEVLRGLGYWFFYGRDKLGPWIESSADYTQSSLHHHQLRRSRSSRCSPPGSSGGATGRSSSCSFVGVIARRRCAPVRLADAVRRCSSSSRRSRPPRLALRSTARPTPLVVLGLAVLLGARTGGAHRAARDGAGIAAAARRRARDRQPAPLWNAFYGKNLQRPEEVPQYWKDAAAHLDEKPTRHARPRAPGRGLRVVPVGEHGRPDHARAHGPAVRRPRADPVRIAGVREPAATRSTSASRIAAPPQRSRRWRA